MRTALVGVIQDLLAVCIAPDPIDAQVGEQGNEEEYENRCHNYVLLSSLPAAEVNGLSPYRSQFKLYPLLKRQGIELKIPLRFGITEIFIFIQPQDLLRFDGKWNM